MMSVVVRFSFEGVHSWPGCPFDQVAFLRSPHRHRFEVEAAKDVSHADREVEIIMLQRDMKAHCDRQFAGPHTASCEQMALELVRTYGLSRCRVLEDGENGAEVTR